MERCPLDRPVPPAAARRAAVGRFLAIALIGWQLATLAAWAQPEPAEPEAKEPAPAPPPATGKLDLVYLPSASGELVPVLGLTLEEFERLYAQELKQESPPSYVLETIDAVVRPQGASAQVEVTATIRCLEAGWVRVPLGWPQLHWTEPPNVEGPVHVRADPQAGALAWIKGEPDQDVTITLTGVCDVDQHPPLAQLEMDVPAANQSRITLHPPPDAGPWEVQSSSGTVQSAEDPQNPTASRVIGAQGHVALRWRPEPAERGEERELLEVVGNIDLVVEGPNTVSGQVELTVQAFGRPIDQFRLRLPPNTTIVPRSPLHEDGSITMQAVESRADGDVWQVRLASPRPQVRLDFQTTTRADGDSQRLTVADYQVVDALRQSGRIRLHASDDWSVQWEEGPLVRRTASDPSEGTSEDLLAVFAYYGQPCRLQVQIEQRQSRIDVEPTYLLHVTRSEVQLEATLAYQIRGAKTSQLSVDMSGWDLLHATPQGLAAADLVVLGDAQPLTFRLPQPQRGDLKLELAARRLNRGDGSRLSLPLPEPQVGEGNLLPARIIVSAAENVSVSPRLDEMPAMVQENLPADLQNLLPAGTARSAVYFFRSRGGAAAEQLVLDVTSHEREVAVSVVNQVHLAAQAIQVQQSFSFRVFYEPVGNLEFELPAPLRQLPDLAWFINGASATVSESDAGGADNSQPNLVNLLLPSARTGRFEVVVTYSLPVDAIRQTGGLQRLYLLMPAAGRVTANQTLVYRDADQWQVDWPPQPAWTEDPDLQRRYGCQLAVTAEGRQPALQLQLQQRSEADLVRLLVGRAWLQTWLDGDQRLDRAVFRITSRQPSLVLRMPAGWDPQQVLVRMNGEATAFQRLDDRRVSVDLPADRRQDHVVEVTYRLPCTLGWWPASLETVQLENATWAARWFWQLIVGQSHYLLRAPDSLTPMDRWRWQGYRWTREPRWMQAELEAWSGARAQPPVPAHTNQYLFFSFHPAGQMEVIVWNRRIVLAIGAGLACLALLLLFRFRALRHWGLTVPLAFALLSIGTVWPTAAVVLGQAALVGVLITLAAQLVLLPARLRRRHLTRTLGGHSTRSLALPAGAQRLAPRGSSVARPAPPPMQEIQG